MRSSTTNARFFVEGGGGCRKVVERPTVPLLMCDITDDHYVDGDSALCPGSVIKPPPPLLMYNCHPLAGPPPPH